MERGQQPADLQLQADLSAVIEAMQALQKRIAADGQPPSMHELDRLRQLGRRYAEILDLLQAGRA